MRPLKLTMSAFGCYSGKEEINFEALGREGLYIITGNTGAGKTTIFDAIAFALYGEPSGDNRQPGMLRSKYAEPDAETSVEFFFTYHGKNYRVKRSPAYERAKQRGEGTTLRQPEAELDLPEGRTVTRLREVDAKIVEILGLTRGQFVQITMIAQGEFLKVLHASTEDRMEIFRKIFYTDKYKTFQDRVKRDASALAADIKEQKLGYEFHLENVQVDLDAVCAAQELDGAKSELLSRQETIAWLASLINTDHETIVACGNALAELRKRLGELNQRLGQAEQDRKARAALSRSIARLPAEETALAEADKAFNAEKAKQPTYEAIKAQIAEIQTSLPKYQQLQALIDAISTNTGRLVDEKQNATDLTAKQERGTQALKAAKDELKTLEDAQAIIEGLSGRKNTLETKQRDLKALQASLAAYAVLLEDLKAAQDDYTAKEEASLQLREDYESLNKAYLDEQAGVLAAELSSGKPCPVCGSTEHPAPAILSGKAPTKAALDEAKKAAIAAERETQEASGNASKRKGQAETKKDEIIASATALLGATTFDNIASVLGTSLSAVKTGLMEVGEQLDKLGKKVARKNELDETIPASESKLIEVGEALGKSKERIASLTTQIDADGKARDRQAFELKYKSETQANAEIAVLDIKKKAFEDALSAAGVAFDIAKEKASNTAAEIETLQRQLADAEPLDYDAIKKEKAAIENAQQDLAHRNQQISTRESANRTALNGIIKAVEMLSAMETRYKWLKELSDTANGDISGRAKIKLETYIQAAYFDSIIARANLRLLQMSNMQFELKRRDAGGKQGQSGLDLNVIDHGNSTERDARSLSGGESFIASLSLALGLSDEIQSNAGGIRLDSMFIDEGFDSLDETKLEQALQALASISQANCLIGIISHVAGLDEKIEKKIMVKKERGGSSKATMQM